MSSEMRLPVLDFGDAIVAAVRENPVTIIVAETGAGKSTQVPQLLHDHLGGASVIVTQPRRLAARTLAARVAGERSISLGGLVGYKTAFEQAFSAETRIMFCTDGLEVVRELSDARRPEVLIVDEVHEWNCNVEVLLAWAKKELAAGMKMKIVIMSATLDAEKLSEFFGGAPVINIPGRLFPVTEELQRGTVVDEALRLTGAGRNVLVFLPGKGEIKAFTEEMKQRNTAAIVVALHGELSPEEQDRAFRSYDRPKVVAATNVAQTSVTIPDIDAVVDSGVEKRVETVDGVEGLYTCRISEADCKQRMGRAGRVKPGIYINCYGGKEGELPFPKPEIQRVRLDQLVLRLAIRGLDMERLEFFHQPQHNLIVDAKRLLRLLGAMNEENKVTKIGRRIADLPISVEHARILVAGEELEAKNPTWDILGDLTIVVGCLEVGGITEKDEVIKEPYCKPRVVPAKWRKLTCEGDSDLIAQMEVYKKMASMCNQKMRENGVRPRQVMRAREIVVELRKRLFDKSPTRNLRKSLEPREQKALIIRCALYGFLDAVYFCGRCGADLRQVGARNSVHDEMPELAIGNKFDIEIDGKFGEKKTLNLLVMVTAITEGTLQAVAPQLMTSSVRYDWMTKNREAVGVEAWTIHLRRVSQFNGTEITSEYLTASYGEAMQMLSGDERARLQESMKRELQYQAEAEKRALAQPIPSWGQQSWAFPAYVPPPPPPPPPKPVIPPSDRATGEWKHREKRDWLCPNGHTVRAPKDQAQKMKCDICGEERDNAVPPETQ